MAYITRKYLLHDRKKDSFFVLKLKASNLHNKSGGSLLDPAVGGCTIN